MSSVPQPWEDAPVPPVAAVTLLPGRGGSLREREELGATAITRAVQRGADLVVLPEAFLPGYEPGPGELGEAARAFALDRAARHRAHVALGYVDAGASWLGLAAPDGGWWARPKRIPSPAERRWWRPADGPAVAQTRLGRLGLAICGEVLFPATWDPWTGEVDGVIVAAAWPDYAGRTGPIARWVAARSPVERDRALAEGARAVGASVAFADATGPWRAEESFAGASRLVHPDGGVVLPAEGLALAELRRAPPGPRFGVRGGWSAFLAVYRALGTRPGSTATDGSPPRPRSQAPPAARRAPRGSPGGSR